MTMVMMLVVEGVEEVRNEGLYHHTKNVLLGYCWLVVGAWGVWGVVLLVVWMVLQVLACVG
jgi:hypothetical protein